MYECHWCLSPSTEVLCAAVIAPWIQGEHESKVASQERLSEYCRCNGCGLYFYSKRFTESQLEMMYSHYRDERYQKHRQRFEPWYTKKVNFGIGNSQETIALRKANLLKLVNRAVINGTISPPMSIVDWGGDQGQFIPDFQHAPKKMVYEISNVKPISGVGQVASIQEIKTVEPDFIMICHVLEHDHCARETINTISELLPKNGILYIEVPDDRIGITPKHHTSVRRQLFLLNHRLLFIVLDAYSLLTLRILKKRMPLQILKQSEHVNFFSRESIVMVMESFGFELIEESRYSINKKVSTAGSHALGLLMKKMK